MGAVTPVTETPERPPGLQGLIPAGNLGGYASPGLCPAALFQDCR